MRAERLVGGLYTCCGYKLIALQSGGWSNPEVPVAIFGLLLLAIFIQKTVSAVNGVAGWGDPEVYLSLIAAVLVFLSLVGSFSIWLYRQFGKFELRFVDSIQSQGEKKASCLALPTGKSSVYIRIKPKTALTEGTTELQFATFNEARYPKRWYPRGTGENIPNSKIKATHVSFRSLEGDWSNPIPTNITERGSFIRDNLPLRKGRRLALKVDYDVDPSMKGWHGILGIEISYRSGGDDESFPINSKVFVQRRPLVMRLRPVVDASPIQQSTADKADSQN